MDHGDGAQGRSAPLRVGAIDVGSNALRFVAAEVAADGVAVREAGRVPVRLGWGAFLAGRLEEDAVDAAVDALAAFRRALDRHRVVRCRAVATSAVRESTNGPELVARARQQAGVDLEVVSAEEEVRLVWIAARDRLPTAGLWLVADLGGGSLELALVDRARIHWMVTHPLGTVRLLAAMDRAGGGAAGRALLDERVGGLALPSIPGAARLDGVLAVGGNAEALADLAGVPAAPDGMRSLPLASLHGAVRALAARTVAERVDVLGLRKDRADVIFPAALVYERIALLTGASALLVPGVGVRDGLLLDLVGRTSVP